TPESATASRTSASTSRSSAPSASALRASVRPEIRSRTDHTTPPPPFPSGAMGSYLGGSANGAVKARSQPVSGREAEEEPGERETEVEARLELLDRLVPEAQLREREPREHDRLRAAPRPARLLVVRAVVVVGVVAESAALRPVADARAVVPLRL